MQLFKKKYAVQFVDKNEDICDLTCGFTQVTLNNEEKILLEASRSGRTDLVREMVRNEKCNINCMTNLDRTPLIMAASKGKKIICKILVDNKANINHPDKYGMTALFWAIYNNHYTIARFLIENDADLYHKTNNGMTIIHLIAKNSTIKMLQFVYEKEPRLEQYFQAKDVEDFTPIHYASQSGNLQVLEFLGENNVDYEVKTKSGKNALHLAIEEKKLLVIRFFMVVPQVKNYINMHDNEGKYPIHYAIDQENIELMRELLLNGSDPNIAAKNCSGPLIYCIRKKNIQMVKLLLEFKADIGASDRSENGVLHLAAMNNDTDMIFFLIKRGVFIENRNRRLQTSLHLAAEQNKLEAAEILILAGADIDVIDKASKTPLHVAVKANLTQMVDLLIKAKRWKKYFPNEVIEVSQLFEPDIIEVVDPVEVDKSVSSDEYEDIQEKLPVFKFLGGGKKKKKKEEETPKEEPKSFIESIKENVSVFSSKTDKTDAKSIFTFFSTAKTDKTIVMKDNEGLERINFDEEDDIKSIPSTVKTNKTIQYKQKDIVSIHDTISMQDPISEKDESSTIMMFEEAVPEKSLDKYNSIPMNKTINGVESKNASPVKSSYGSPGSSNTKSPLRKSNENSNLINQYKTNIYGNFDLASEIDEGSNDIKVASIVESKNLKPVYIKEDYDGKSVFSKISKKIFHNRSGSAVSEKHEDIIRINSENDYNKIVDDYVDNNIIQQIDKNFVDTIMNQETDTIKLDDIIRDYKSDYQSVDMEERILQNGEFHPKTFSLLNNCILIDDRIKEIFINLAYKKMSKRAWELLANYWNFELIHIAAIKYCEEGKHSYKNHSYRTLCIWLHGLRKGQIPIEELGKALTAIGEIELSEYLREELKKSIRNS